MIGTMKTEASRKPLPLDEELAAVLTGWRGVGPYNQDGDYIFASPDMDGKQPYWPTSAMADYIRPAAVRAGITKRLGWHTLRHTFGTLVKNLFNDAFREHPQPRVCRLSQDGSRFSEICATESYYIGMDRLRACSARLLHLLASRSGWETT
jgi:hypothetical protein